MNKIFDIIDKLRCNGALEPDEYMQLLLCEDGAADERLRSHADQVRRSVFSNKVYIRGLIEFTNYCKNDCLYCGIRRSNKNAERFRLTKEQILGCARDGYALGFRTFVLQGGEDPYYTDERMVDIISSLRKAYPECAITLSVGEKSRESYQSYFDAGANRYLLRHETANPEHYARLHPPELSLENRIKCLETLKKIGFQVGCGFMVGSPFQTHSDMVRDLMFIKEFQPHMVGIGPFIPHRDTPFRDRSAGTAGMTLRLLSMVRLMLPNVLLPATTALNTIDNRGRIEGIRAGANVVMPNLSPQDAREKYLLYDNKLCTGDEAAESLINLKRDMLEAGYEVVVSRGDHPNI